MFKPVGERIIFEPINDNISAGGIIIPDAENEHLIQGKAIAIGPGRVTEFGINITVNQIKIGDECVLQRFNASQIRYKGKIFYIAREGDVVAIIDKEEE